MFGKEDSKRSDIFNPGRMEIYSIFVPDVFQNNVILRSMCAKFYSLCII